MSGGVAGESVPENLVDALICHNPASSTLSITIRSAIARASITTQCPWGMSDSSDHKDFR
jgi:hypothetical protein